MLQMPRAAAYLVLAVCLLAGECVAAAGPVKIVENHQSQWRIASPSLETPGVPWAIQELRKYVELISGARLAYGRLSDGKPADDVPEILIGLRKEFSAEDQRSLPSPAKGHDGYAIAVRAGPPPRILIAGDNGRGAIYGVYDLLERLGCRWVYPAQDPNDPEIVPRAASLAIPAGAWAVASPMKHRIYNGDAWYFNMDLPDAAKQVDHAMKVRCNLIGWQCAVDRPLREQYSEFRARGVLAEIEKRDLGLHGPAHSFNLFLPNEHFSKHPDWFGMRDGKRVPQNFFGAQFCWSNAEARKCFVENVAEFARAAPQIRVLAIVPFDGGKACDCPDCRRTGASNCLLTLMREVIARLETIRPDLLVETVGGYAPMIQPPTVGAIHPKQRIAWAHWGRYMAFGYDDPRYDRKNLEAWQKAAPGGMTIVQYYGDNFAEPWVMPPFALAIQGDRRYLLDRSIDSIYFLTYPPGYWWNHSLNTYLAGRCFYDASLDPFDLVRDYAKHYYGPKAGPLLAQYYDQWARNPDLGYHVRGGTTRRDRETLARQRTTLIDPAIAAAQPDRVYAHRVGKVAALHALAERLAEGHHLRHQVQAARHASDFARAAKLLATARTHADAIMACFEDLARRNQGLIDNNEVAGFIKLGVKGWLDAEEKAIAAKDTRVNEKELREDSDTPTEAKQQR